MATTVKDVMKAAFIAGRSEFDKIPSRCEDKFYDWYDNIGILEQAKWAVGQTPTSEKPEALPLKLISFSETPVICPNCGKYKRLQGNGIIHQLCECGSEAEVCSHEFELEEAWIHKCIKCGEIQIEYKEQT